MNLAETQVKVRKFLLVLSIVTFSYYSLKFIFFQSVDFYRSLRPIKIAEPQAAFGILPKLKMRNIKINGNPSYMLDTIDGSFPALPDRLNVYKVKTPEATLLSEQQIKQLATDLGFTGNYVPISKSEFRWLDGINNRTLTAHAITKLFSLDTPISKISTAIFQSPTITSNDAINLVTGFIRSKGLVNTVDSPNLKTEAIPAQLSLGVMKETNELSTSSKIIKVNVHRIINTGSNSKSTSYVVYGPNPKDSKMSFFATNQGGVFKFPIINFTYWDTDYTNASEYYISPISTIWEAVKAGKGITAYAKGKDDNYFDPPNFITASEVVIREVYLAYFEQTELPKYLQPIYVFEGIYKYTGQNGQTQNGDIILYYPAVRGDFVN